MKRSLLLLTIAPTVLLAARSPARADLITAGPAIRFTYNWFPVADPNKLVDNTQPLKVLSDSGQGYVQLTNEWGNTVAPPTFLASPDGGPHFDPFHLPGSDPSQPDPNSYKWLRDTSVRNAPFKTTLPALGTNAPVSKLTTGPTTGPTDPELGTQTFTNKPFALALALTEWDRDPKDPTKWKLTSLSKPLVFHGHINSSFSQDGSNLSVLIDSQDAFQSAKINGNTYYIQMPDPTAPGTPTATQTGSVPSYITVVPAGTGSIAGVPEPSTLVLSWLGLSFLGAAGWRKRRQVLPA